MAGRQDIEAGSAFIRLYVQDDDVESGLQRVRDELSGVRRVVDDVVSGISRQLSSGLSVESNSLNTKAAQAQLSSLKTAAQEAVNAISKLRASSSGPINLSSTQTVGMVASRAVSPLASSGARDDLMRLNSPRFVASSGFGGTTGSRTLITNEGVFRRSGFLGELLGIGKRGSREEFEKLKQDLIAGKKGADLGSGSKFFVRTAATASDLRSINQVNTSVGSISRNTLSRFQGAGEFDRMLRSRTGLGENPHVAPMASPAASAAAKTASTPAAQTSLASSAAQAITTQARAAAAAATTMAAPVQRSIELATRLRIATSAAGSALTSAGMRMGIAGAAIAAIALPLKLVTDRFGSSAMKVKEYAEKYGVSIDTAIKKTNSALTANQVKLGVALAKSWSNIKDSASKAWDSVAASIGSVLSPQLTERALMFQGVAKGIEAAGKSVAAFAANNQPVVSAVLGVSTAAAAMGAVVVGAGTVISVLGANLTVLGGVAAALMSPMSLATAAVVGGAYAWTQYTKSGQAALSSVVEAMRPFVTIARDTMAGVSDAIMAGDLGLAWSVASTGMKLAATVGFDQLTELVGGRTQEAVSAIVGKLLSGDISGAWNTAVLSLAAVWDNFTAGFVSTFANAAKAVVDAWAGAVKTIANMLLEQSAAGGVTGSIATAILGVDMAEEQRRSDELDAKLKLQRTNVVEEAKKDVERNMGETTKNMKSFIDSLNEDMKTKAAETTSRLDMEIAGASDKNKDRTKELRDELDKLRADAKAKADVVRDKGLSEIKIKTKTPTFGTFSASAAMAVGAKYDGPAIRMAKDVAAQRKLQEDQLKVAEKTREAIDKLQLQWTA